MWWRSLDGLGIDASWDLLSGDPAEAIVAAARQMGSPLLVVGTHSRSETGHPALGRVSFAVVRKALCPVLVVPSTPGCGGLGDR